MVSKPHLCIERGKVAVHVHQLSLSAWDMRPHIITLPPPKLSTSRTQFLWTSHSGVCRHVYGHLFSAAWILIHCWTRLASSFAVPSPLLCCTIGPLQVDADFSVLRQSKDVWRVQAVFTKTVSDCLCRYSSETSDIWWCFSCYHGPVSQVKYPDVEILGCWCVRDVLQTNGGHNIYWLWSDVIWTLWTLMW